MRELKFRAWRTDDKYMVTSPRGVYTALQHVMGLASQPHFSNIDNQPDASRFVVMQYIGRKDKNNVEIYDGDIVYSERSGNRGEVFYLPRVAGHMVDCSVTDRWVSPNDDWSDYEVIGNTYENPELLEAQG